MLNDNLLRQQTSVHQGFHFLVRYRQTSQQFVYASQENFPWKIMNHYN